MKRFMFKGLAAVLAMMMLGGCGANGNGSEEVSASSVVESIAESTASATESETDLSEEQEQEAVSTEKEFAETPRLDEYCETVEFPEGIEMIQFSGNAKSEFVSDNYSAYESEKYILLVDKNVRLPGNYTMILDDIVDEIEKITGLSLATEKKAFTGNMHKTLSGDLPWEGLKSGNKYIVQLKAESKATNGYYAPETFIGYMVVTGNGLTTFEGEPVTECDYDRMIEAFLYGLFGNKYPNVAYLDSIVGVIEHYVVEDLEEKYPDFKRMSNDINSEAFPASVTAENVEEAWISHEDWENWYESRAIEQMFDHFMLETYGTGYLPSIISDNYADKEMTRAELAVRIKSIYGDDIFEKYLGWVHGKQPERPQEITLDAAKEGFFHVEENCYVEGERCFLYIEKDLSVPYDYVKTTDAVIAALEKSMWNVDSSKDYGTSIESYSGQFYGISNNGKLPYALNLDKDQMGYISCYWGPDVSIYDYGMRDASMEEMEYSTLAHETSHAVMGAYGEIDKIGKIMTEGSADYYAELIGEELNLPNQYNYHFYNYSTPLNEQTAESLFLSDFADVNHADRGIEYEYGYQLCTYLAETYGDSFLIDYTAAIRKSGISEENTASDCEKRVAVMKSVFGDDVFTKFGKWYADKQ